MFIWFKVLTGAWNQGGPMYGLWSGFIPAIGFPISIIGAMIAHLRHINCHTKGCLRVSRHDYEMNGVTLKLCRKHHPGMDDMPTAQELRDYHATVTS